MRKGKLFPAITGLITVATVAQMVVGIVQLKHALSTQEIQNSKVQRTLSTTQSKLKSTQRNLSETKAQLDQANKKILSLNTQLAKAKNTVTILSGRSEDSLLNAPEYDVLATAYGSSTFDGGGGTGITAMGTQARANWTIAVDPRLIPLGSKVELVCSSDPSINGIYRAEDTGGAIQGYRIDIFMNAHTQMMSFGRRMVKLFVLPNK